MEIGADLAIMMSDIDGVFTKPPNSKHEDSRVYHTFIPSDLEMVEFGNLYHEQISVISIYKIIYI